MIQNANPKAQYLSHKEEIDAAVKKILDSGWYILGREVKAFEDEFSGYIGVSNAIGVSNGTDALYLSLLACGVGKEDEVITVSHTAVATVAAIVSTGAKPVFVDIDPDTYTMNPQIIEKSITTRTKAILPVHIYGHPAEIEDIKVISRENHLYLIEDCAQAHGSIHKNRRVGSFGDISCFSFYPTKNLGGLGDGGMILTDNEELAEKCRLLREYGWKERYVSHMHGINSRLDEIQAAVLRVKLKYLDRDNAARSRIADLYREGLHHTELELPMVKGESTHVYHLFVVRYKQRDDLLNFLYLNDIGASIHYPYPVHMQPAYSYGNKWDLPETERISREIISLPIYPELTDKEIYTVIDAIKEFIT